MELLYRALLTLKHDEKVESEHLVMRISIQRERERAPCLGGKKIRVSVSPDLDPKHLSDDPAHVP